MPLRRLAVPMLILMSVILLMCTVNLTGTPGDTESASRRVERIVGGRMLMLDSYMDRALHADKSHFLWTGSLPDDMAIYRYCGDTLVSWINQFTTTNDDIATKYLFETLGNPKAEVVSPLTYATEEASLINMGSRWYLVRSVSDGDDRVIGGLIVMDEMDRTSFNGANPHFHLNDRFSIRPLTYSGGSAVSYKGVPQFKILYDSMQGTVITNAYLVWLALALFIAAMLLFLHERKNLRRYCIAMGGMIAAMVMLYFWGLHVQNDSKIFSPALYADGGLLYSIGAFIVADITIILAVVCTYMIRKAAMRDIWEKCADPRRPLIAVTVALALVLAAIVAYAYFALRSITLNSGICLELYKFGELDRYTAVVYVGFAALMVTIPLLLQMMRPGVKALTGLKYDAFSTASRTLQAVCFAAFMVACTSVFGFRREQDRQVVWANRLAVERDLGLEMQLRMSENAIASDVIIGALASVGNSANTVLGRIAENYLTRISQDYDMSVYIVNSDSATAESWAFLQSRLEGGLPIAPDSHFTYHTSHSSRTSYTGHFVYVARGGVVSHVVMEVEAKANRADKGYSSLLGISAPGKVALPSRYSYARYSGSDLVTSGGKYSYPNIIDNNIYDGGRHYTEDGYVHFVNIVSEGNAVIISRQKMEKACYLTVGLLLALAMYFILCLLLLTKKRVKPAKAARSYYKTRVTFVLIFSLVVTLVSMAAVSVVFVYRRNDANMKAMMTDKVNSIRAVLESSCEGAASFRDLSRPEFTGLVDEASNMLGADITLYNPQGKVFYSTTPEIFDRSLLGTRIDEKAYNAVMFRGRRCFIQKESIGDRKYFSLYAPVYNASGQLVSILKSPYTDENFDFEMEAVFHFATILAVFLLLLIVARFAILRVVGRLFKPLEEMSSKMSATDVDSLEYISYDNDDEISSLVTSYNRMVSDLSESTRQLAQAERDKAWSAMARQVAHEIKNPLTPMKLQIQRIMRLKEKQMPGWEDKLDVAMGIVLDHIDVLTDTANEFSTFAKLYSEDPVNINVDALLQEEIAMFDNRENIAFEYFGLEGASIMGPKPQLTRVFVNLLANSVQAIGEAPSGRILVSLRNSAEDGWYDIVFEDNGPGVDAANQEKLFTPNFTTKSSGTGLGLAISRSILEKCGATISYSKSFALGGACFSIHYPKKP